MSRKIKQPKSVAPEIRLAERTWGANISGILREHLKELIQTIGISVAAGDIQLIDGRWYVTHAGLLSLARRLQRIRWLWRCRPKQCFIACARIGNARSRNASRQPRPA
jgi:hypothetical protein